MIFFATGFCNSTEWISGFSDLIHQNCLQKPPVPAIAPSWAFDKLPRLAKKRVEASHRDAKADFAAPVTDF